MGTARGNSLRTSPRVQYVGSGRDESRPYIPDGGHSLPPAAGAKYGLAANWVLPAVFLVRAIGLAVPVVVDTVVANFGWASTAAQATSVTAAIATAPTISARAERGGY